MISFSNMWEHLSSPLMDSGEDEKAISVIKAGLDLHPERAKTFWQEFIILCQNTEGMAELLGVSKDKARGFSSRIRYFLEQLEKRKHESPGFKEKKQLIPTGDNGAFTPTTTYPNFR